MLSPLMAPTRSTSLARAFFLSAVFERKRFLAPAHPAGDAAAAASDAAKQQQLGARRAVSALADAARPLKSTHNDEFH